MVYIASWHKLFCLIFKSSIVWSKHFTLSNQCLYGCEPRCIPKIPNTHHYFNSEAFEHLSEMSHVSQRGKMISLLITMFRLVSAVCSGGSAPPPALTLSTFPIKLLKDKSPVDAKCFKPTGVKPIQPSCWDLHPQSMSPWTSPAVIMPSLNISSVMHWSVISTGLLTLSWRVGGEGAGNQC